MEEGTGFFRKFSQLSLKESVFLFKETFIRPRSKDEDSKRREFILNILLSFCIFLSGWSVLSATRTMLAERTAYQGTPPWILLIIFSMFCVLLALSRRGLSRISAGVFVGSFLLIAMGTLWVWGADLPLGLLSLAVVIIMSSILIGIRFSFLLTAAVGACLLLLTKFQADGVIAVASYWRTQKTDLSGSILTTVVLFIIMGVSWLSNHEMEKSLHRARASEAALMHERDQLEIKVEERTADLKRVQNEKMMQLSRFAEFGQLASGFFHDLANPLTALSLNLELIQRSRPQDVSETQQHLDRALEVLHRMEGFLHVIRRQYQNKAVAIVFDPIEEVEQAVNVLSYKARKARVAMTTSFDIEPRRAYGNPYKLNQVVTNLIANAIDAYDDAPPKNRREVAVSVKKDASNWELRVQDWACGMDEKTLERIFDPFFTTKDPERGSGIGLSTVRTIVEKELGGSISVESVPGEGSIFVVRVPVRREPAA